MFFLHFPEKTRIFKIQINQNTLNVSASVCAAGPAQTIRRGNKRGGETLKARYLGAYTEIFSETKVQNAFTQHIPTWCVLLGRANAPAQAIRRGKGVARGREPVFRGQLGGVDFSSNTVCNGKKHAILLNFALILSILLSFRAQRPILPRPSSAICSISPQLIEKSDGGRAPAHAIRRGKGVARGREADSSACMRVFFVFIQNERFSSKRTSKTPAYGRSCVANARARAIRRGKGVARGWNW